jgi:hypothetical protein
VTNAQTPRTGSRVLLLRLRHLLGSTRRRVGRRLIQVGTRVGGGGVIAPSLHADFRSHGLDHWSLVRKTSFGSAIQAGWVRETPAIGEPASTAVVVHVGDAGYGANLEGVLSSIGDDVDVIIVDSSGNRETRTFDSLPVRSVRVLRFGAKKSAALALALLAGTGFLDPYDVVIRVRDASALTDRSAFELGQALAAFSQRFDLGLAAPRLHLRRAMPDEASAADVAAWLWRLQMARDHAPFEYSDGPVTVHRGFVIQALKSFHFIEPDFNEADGERLAELEASFDQLLGYLTRESGLATAAFTDLADADPTTRPESPKRGRARVLAFRSVGLGGNRPAVEAGSGAWTEIAIAQPLYSGHWQPNLPLNSTFDTPDSPQTVQHQADLLAEYGLEGFAFRVTAMSDSRDGFHAVDAFLESDTDRQFCLVWSPGSAFDFPGNERPSKITQGESAAFLERIQSYLEHPRALTLASRPLLVVEKPHRIAAFGELLDDARFTVLPVDDGTPTGIARRGADHMTSASIRLADPLRPDYRGQPDGLDMDRRYNREIYDYRSLADQRIADTWTLDEHMLPAVTVDYDSTSLERFHAGLLLGANPFTFHRWLSAAVTVLGDREIGERVVFVQAWSDWFVRAALEPSERFENSYLLAVRAVVGRP